MPTFEVDADPNYVFAIDGVYLFVQYFEQEGLFEDVAEFCVVKEQHTERADRTANRRSRCGILYRFHR